MQKTYNINISWAFTLDTEDLESDKINRFMLMYDLEEAIGSLPRLVREELAKRIKTLNKDDVPGGITDAEFGLVFENSAELRENVVRVLNGGEDTQPSAICSEGIIKPYPVKVQGWFDKRQNKK